MYMSNWTHNYQNIYNLGYAKGILKLFTFTPFAFSTFNLSCIMHVSLENTLKLNNKD